MRVRVRVSTPPQSVHFNDTTAFVLIAVTDTVLAAYITCHMLYILKTGKGHFKETKEQDTVDRTEKKKEEGKAGGRERDRGNTKVT